MEIGLYADGDYFCKCILCSEVFHGDKRAVHCLRCAAKNMKAQLDAHRWIKVEERLPEENGEYLVLPRIKYCPSLWWQGGEWFWYNRTCDCISDTIGHNMDEPIPEVTHWMPIPELPEGE